MVNRLLPDNWKIARRELWAAIAIGACGFMLNMLELQLGWGLHFMFGNAVVFAFIRVLNPGSFVVAASLSSLRSLFLWNHPWAWIIWSLEAAFIARLAHRTSPIRGDVIFWLLIGTPLLLLSYGAVMDMDRLSLALVVAKQATNGTLNVVLGEFLYFAVLVTRSRARRSAFPRMPVDSFLMMILMAIILIPTTVYLSLDAPSREQAARDEVDQMLRERLEIVDATLSMWVRSRSLMLELHAGRESAGAGQRQPDLAVRLASEFSAIAVLPPGARRGLPAGQIPGAKGPRLAAMAATDGNERPDLALIVPTGSGPDAATVVARLRPNALSDLVSTDGFEDVFIAHPASGPLPLSAIPANLSAQMRNLPESLQVEALGAGVLLSETSYGNALMSDLRDARMLRTGTIAALPEWRAYAVGQLAPQVLEAREGQLQLFTALSAFVLLVTALGTLLSRKAQQSLRHLARSAADLAMLGTQRRTIDDLVISELDDISGTIAAARWKVSREHGALVSHRRRLESIARHAPVVVYALDIVDRRKAGLVYVSDALEKILGYRLADVTQPGWWTHAIHPLDYDRCLAAFSDLEPGKVVSLEYRLRHRDGRYIWLYDTLAVEAGLEAGQVEAVGLLIDITERKVSAERLLQADKMASLGRLISGTAHELNQPLNFIKMAAVNLREQVRRGPLEEAGALPRLERILDHVSRASAIILQMRVFGRTPDEVPHPVDIKASIDSVVSMIEPQLAFDGTRIDASRCREGLAVRALPVLLEQVLLNLLLNANDAIRLRRSSGDERPGLITISLEQRGAEAVLTVIDNGTGLAEDVMPLLFEPFFTTKPPREGTGLGLSISYGIIRDLGGSITAGNKGRTGSKAAGARFVIVLPLADSQAAGPSRPAP